MNPFLLKCSRDATDAPPHHHLSSPAVVTVPSCLPECPRMKVFSDRGLFPPSGIHSAKGRDNPGGKGENVHGFLSATGERDAVSVQLSVLWENSRTWST